MQPSDTTLHNIVPRVDEGYLSGNLVEQVKQMHRTKMLKGSGLCVNGIAIDGKSLGAVTHDAAGITRHRKSSAGQKWGSAPESDGHCVLPILCGVLVSAEQRPMVVQKSIPPDPADSAVFGKFFDGLKPPAASATLLTASAQIGPMLI